MVLHHFDIDKHDKPVDIYAQLQLNTLNTTEDIALGKKLFDIKKTYLWQCQH